MRKWLRRFDGTLASLNDRSGNEFLKKARAHVSYSNTVRRNSGTEMKTPRDPEPSGREAPWELMVERAPETPKRVAPLTPVILDELAEARVTGKNLQSSLEAATRPLNRPRRGVVSVREERG